MDTQAINSVGNPTGPTGLKPKRITSKSDHAAQPSSASTGDKVNLSQEAQSLSRRDGASTNKINYTDGKQKKISISDNNDIVLEIRDPQTQEVVRSVPSKEQLELKKAIQNELDKI
jgi:uncharacterized FlaG/YvyC family protein